MRKLLARNSHGYVGADLQQLCMEAALECIRGKMGLIDFDKDSVDKKILDSIVVEGKHFDYAMSIVHPSSLRESYVEVPDVHWEDVGGLEDVKRELHETVQYPVEHADKYIKFGMSPKVRVFCFMDRLGVERHSLPRRLPTSAVPTSSVSRDLSS
jgi:transitional endoplasmic reticulum ATPase